MWWYIVKDKFYDTGHTDFTPKDAQLVQKEIDYKCVADKVKAERCWIQIQLRPCIHNQVFCLYPKRKTHKRTLKARNFNTTVIDSVQLANSALALNKSAGLTLSLKALLGLRSKGVMNVG